MQENNILEELEEVKSLLIKSCPDWVVGDIMTPRPKCCSYHYSAKVILDAQNIIQSLKEGSNV